MKSKQTHFPCPVCKGKGGYTEVVTDDGQGPYYACYPCNDEGFIEIGSETHKKYFFNSDQWYSVIYKFDGRDFDGEEEARSLTKKEKALYDTIKSSLEEFWISLAPPVVREEKE